jgi:excisionase family DNA binding protein
LSRNFHNTQQAAEAVGITRATLQAWIAKRKIKAPRTQLRDGHAVRLWTDSDVARLRQVKKQIYRKEMGRPPKEPKA